MTEPKIDPSVLMSLPWKKHFGVKCEKCDAMDIVPVTAEQYEMEPAAMLRSLPEKDRMTVLRFFMAHQSHGAEPVRMEIAPLPTG